MGKDQDELTLEDYKILGEEPPEELLKQENEGDSQETGEEGTEEVKDEEPDYDELARKHELLKSLGPEGYYKLYPDEAPTEDKETEEPEKKEPQPDEVLGLTLDDGPYKGKTLREVFKEDPAYATGVYVNHTKELDRIAQQEEKARSSRLSEAQAEIDSFSGNLAKDLFNKDMGKLTEKEVKAVEARVTEVLDWMEKTKRGGGVLSDAYALMNLESNLKNVRREAAGRAAKVMTEHVVPSTSGGDHFEGNEKGYDKFLEMTESQVAATIERMDDSEYKSFLKRASKELRSKFPKVPWI